jgi:hypothetical protein
MSALGATLEAGEPQSESEREWVLLSGASPSSRPPWVVI